MLDFFNALSDLIKSDLIKSNIGIITITLIIIIVLSCFGTWEICTKFFLQIKLNQISAKEQKFNEMQTKIQTLECENQKLEKQLKKYKIEDALDYKESENVFDDPTLDKFIRKEK